MNIMFSGGPLIGKTLMLEGLLNIGFRNSTLDVLTVYPDGSKSQGYEFDINGVYTTFTPCYEAGFAVGIRLGRIILNGRISRALNFLGNDRGEGATTLTDFDVNRYRYNEFPRDFKVWLDNNPNTVTENVVYSGELRGTRIAFGIDLLLFKPKSLQP
ncbi:MAG: hypothetical protein IPL65_11515 [Lewinellaceae bacterium]|nr:hypothetical protein [Lewinellaceae bacterium]